MTLVVAFVSRPAYAPHHRWYRAQRLLTFDGRAFRAVTARSLSTAGPPACYGAAAGLRSSQRRAITSAAGRSR